MHTKEILEKALTKAKIDLMKCHNTTFVSTVMCSLEVSFEEGAGTAYTNGKYIKIDPLFFMDLPEGQRAFLLAHETMHVVYQHMLRLGGRDPKRHNYAADYVINLELVNQGLEMIPIGLIDTKYEGMSTEQVYDLLPESLPQNGMDGDLRPTDDGEDGEADLTASIQEMTIRATQISDMRQRGSSVPGSVRRQLLELSKPKVDWKVVLRRFMTALTKASYSWARPNRRYQDIYMPSSGKIEALDKISIAVDVSASITLNQFSAFISESFGLFKTTKPKEMEFIQFDQYVQSVDIVKSKADLHKIKFTGHGGTYPEVALRHFENSGSKALVLITDGEFSTRNLFQPKRPVIWVIFNDPNWKAPYGKSLHIDIER